MTARPDPFNLEGRHALVTGAGSPTGIGIACARVLGALGASITVTSTSKRIHERAGELRREGFDVDGVVADLTEEDDVARLVDAASARSPVTVAVNNAGMVSVSRPASSGKAGELSLTDWRAEFDRNVTTAFLVARAAAPQMISEGWGRIVNVSSVTGPVAAIAADVAYATGKAAMLGLTRSLAIDLARLGVTVNAVAPGWIETGRHFRVSSGTATAHRSVAAEGPRRWRRLSPGWLRRALRTSPASCSSSTVGTQLRKNGCSLAPRIPTHNAT